MPGGLTPDPGGRAPQETNVILEELAALLNEAIAVLTQRQLVVILLRYGAGLTFEATADLFHVTVPAVHQMERRALRMMRAQLLRRRIRSLSDLLP